MGTIGRQEMSEKTEQKTKAINKKGKKKSKKANLKKNKAGQSSYFTGRGGRR